MFRTTNIMDGIRVKITKFINKFGYTNMDALLNTFYVRKNNDAIYIQ